MLKYEGGVKITVTFLNSFLRIKEGLLDTIRYAKAKEAIKSTLNFNEKIREVSSYLEPYVIQLRQKLHEIPELGWEEEKTLALIKREIAEAMALSECGYAISMREAEGGVWVDVKVSSAYSTVLFRSDIDALPIQEETGLSFASKHPGKMHACGHDCHTAMLLGAFQAIMRGLIKPKANIRFVWQRAEEFSENRSGGQRLVEEGVCKGVDVAYGLHISSLCEPGVFYSRPGVMMANASLLSFTIECTGGHVMRPHVGSNAIYIMTDIHNALRGFEGIYFGPEEPIAFVPSIAHAGIAHNIRPNLAKMCFALRNFLSAEERDAFIDKVHKKVQSIVETYPSARLSHVEFLSGYPSLETDPDTYMFIKQGLEDLEMETKRIDLMFSGEDFSFYLEKVPGSFWILGAKQEEAWDHHTSKFNPDEAYLKDGLAFWLLLSQRIPPQ